MMPGLCDGGRERWPAKGSVEAACRRLGRRAPGRDEARLEADAEERPPKGARWDALGDPLAPVSPSRSERCSLTAVAGSTFLRMPATSSRKTPANVRKSERPIKRVSAHHRRPVQAPS